MATEDQEPEAGEKVEGEPVEENTDSGPDGDQGDGAANEAQADNGEKEPQSASFSSLEPKDPDNPVGNLDFILDVPLRITVHLGGTKMIIRDLLQLGQGSVVELDKLAGEPMDVFIGEKLVARGEVVVVNEKFGIRLTDIVTPVERVQQLNK
ncbi:MAG: flagellar motor switch protein FliN [Nitrospiria bacterium]